jgi:hypothetical protein
VDRFVVAAVFVVDDVVAVVDVVMVMVVGATTAGVGTDMDDVVIVSIVVDVPNKTIGATTKKFRKCNKRDATTHNTMATKQHAVA